MFLVAEHMGLFGTKATIDVTSLKDKMSHRMAYVGLERGNIVIGIAKTAIGAGLKVCIVDNSITHDIYQVYASESSDRWTVRGNLSIVKDGVVDDNNRGYDLVIFYHGCSMVENIGADYIVAAAGADAMSLRAVRAIKEEAGKKNKKAVYLYRDVNKAYPVKEFCHVIGVPDTSRITCLPYDMKEVENYNLLTRDRTANVLMGMSTSAEITLTISEEILALDRKTVAKCAKKGEQL